MYLEKNYMHNTSKTCSSGLKNKNIKIINGKPLLYWPIKAAKKSKIIDEIVVTTD